MSSCPCLYVANVDGGSFGVGSVTVYASGATGNASPIQTIVGTNTALSDPQDVAVDATGEIYVPNLAGQSVTVYAAGATGDVSPVRTISGSATGLDQPSGIALDPVNGNIYVANGTNNSITIYSSNANGNVAPIGVIRKAGLNDPTGLAFDAHGKVYVPNSNGGFTQPCNSSIIARGGSAGSTQKIAGKNTQLCGSSQIALDSSMNMYVANSGGGGNGPGQSLTVYAARANGDVAPIDAIAGDKTNLDHPFGIALDGSKNIFAADHFSSTITVYAAGSNGDVAPINTISGANTGLDGPGGIVIR